MEGDRTPAKTKTKAEAKDSHPEPLSTTPPIQDIRTEEVSKLAHEFWIQRGCPEGSPEEDWYRAEREFALRRKPGSVP